jgi:bifunctional ADP-heptose synthase (sugar kinase/adenylyltransferase)
VCVALLLLLGVSRFLHPGVSRFLPTSRRLVQFSEGKFAPEGATIVYIDGAFDVFHVGHVEILEVRCSSRCSHIINSFICVAT